MKFIETIARRELGDKMDVKFSSTTVSENFWIDICLAKIAYAYYQILLGDRSEDYVNRLAWLLWIKTTGAFYTSTMKGCNFGKKTSNFIECEALFCKAYEQIYGRYVGKGGGYGLYRSIFTKFLEDNNVYF